MTAPKTHGGSDGPANGCTRRLTRADATTVNDLRVREYATATEFQLLRPDLLQWGSHDDDGALVGIWSDGLLLSTLRGIVVADRAAAEDLLTCTVDLPADCFPALVLGRGATRSDQRGRGLNALLRLHFLGAVLRERRVATSLALPYDGAPRLRLMQRLGYEVSRPAATWDPEAREVRPALLAVLPRSRFLAAAEQLRTLTADNGSRYPWRGEPLRLPPAVVGRDETAMAGGVE